MLADNNTQAFFALVKAGLWEQDVRLSQFGNIDYSNVLDLAEEQSVVGLVAAGMEHVVDVKVPKEDVLQFVGSALQLEQRNQAMNHFIGDIVDKMREAGIYTLLIKGQGIAQCYERPLWRACGDVDFLLSDDNYSKAKSFLFPLASSSEPEGEYQKHQGMTIGEWSVELHGNFRCGLSNMIDRVLDDVQRDIFYGGNVRSWMNGKTQIFLPAVDNDVLIIFTHYLEHFFKGGVGLRQVCDWCRLLWTYQNDINISLLRNRLKSMGLMSEWKAFATFAVECIGMPVEAMPFYTRSKRYKRKAYRILSYIIETGNFGHNRDFSYKQEKSTALRKLYNFYHITADSAKLSLIFPLTSIKAWSFMMLRGLKGVLVR